MLFRLEEYIKGHVVIGVDKIEDSIDLLFKFKDKNEFEKDKEIYKARIVLGLKDLLKQISNNINFESYNLNILYTFEEEENQYEYLIRLKTNIKVMINISKQDIRNII